MIISIQNSRKTVSTLIKKMVQKEYRLQRLECVRRDIFRNWVLTKNWYSAMSKQGSSSPGFNFNPSDTFYGRVETPQGQQNLHIQRETERPSSEARSDEPTVDHRPQYNNEGTGFRGSHTSPLPNLSHTLESRLPLNNHEQTPNRSVRTPSIQRGFAQNIFSRIGFPFSRANFLPCNTRAGYEAWKNRNQDNTMLQYATNVTADSTGVDETGAEEEGTESEGVCEISGSMPAQSTAIGQLPEFRESFGSSIQREEPVRGMRAPRQHLQSNVSSMNSRVSWEPSPSPRSSELYQSPSPQSDDLVCSAEAHQTSRGRYGFDHTMPAQSTAAGQLPEFRETFGSPIQRERPTRGLRASPSPQSSNSRSYSPTSNKPLKSPDCECSDEQLDEDLDGIMLLDKYDMKNVMAAQSTAKGRLPQFRESFGSPIPKEKPIKVLRVPPQYVRPNVSILNTKGKWSGSGSATPRSEELCESPSPMSDDIEPSRATIHGGVRYPEPRRLFQGSPFKYGVDSTMPYQSTAIGQLPQFHESFGSPIARERPMRGLQPSYQYMQPSISRTGCRSNCDRSASPRSDEVCESPSPQSGDLRSCSRSPQCGDIRSHSSSPTSDEIQSKSSDRQCKASPKRSYQTQCGTGDEESFLERFDKAVEKELERYRIEGPADTSMSISMPRPLEPSHSQALDSVTSSIEIISRMKGEQDTELTEAVEKLAKAEATVLFQGAIEAAEKAAANAPPEYAEEAAAASARAHAKIYNAELTNVVQESVPGIRPIEIVGYVGVTRPKKPLKP